MSFGWWYTKPSLASTRLYVACVRVCGMHPFSLWDPCAYLRVFGIYLCIYFCLIICLCVFSRWIFVDVSLIRYIPVQPTTYRILLPDQLLLCRTHTHPSIDSTRERTQDGSEDGSGSGNGDWNGDGNGNQNGEARGGESSSCIRHIKKEAE